MNRKAMKKIAMGLICAAGISAAAPAAVNAMDWGGVVGTVLGGAMAYKEVDAYVHYVNDTEEGRQAYYQEMKDSMGVNYDEYHNAMLDTLMNNLTEGVAAHDATIQDKPFLYFLNNDKSFNASCGLGHVMTVNTGLFRISDNIDEVAFVIGHEMGHGMKNHSLKGTQKKMRTIIGASVAAEAMGGGAAANIAMNALVGQINNIQITKKQEWEADNLAFDYCYSAGYNPGAGAAIWVRVNEKMGEFKINLVGEIFSPNDHPSNHDRQMNYEKKLTQLSGGHVTIKKETDIVEINGKEFTTPAALGDMSSAERKYFLMGNLAAAYDHGENKKAATNRNGTVYLGDQSIMTPVEEDETADALVKKLNAIK